MKIPFTAAGAGDPIDELVKAGAAAIKALEAAKADRQVKADRLADAQTRHREAAEAQLTAHFTLAICR